MLCANNLKNKMHMTNFYEKLSQKNNSSRGMCKFDFA